MAKSIENKEEITFIEFRAWLTGLIRGKRGEIPDFTDWKQIKIMMDKVEEGRKYQDFESPPYHPPIFLDPPHTTTYDPSTTWCTTESTNFTFGDMNVETPELKDPALGDIDSITTGKLQSREEFDENVNEFNTAMEELLKRQEEKYGR